MRILHTADLHLGRQLEGYPLDDDHAGVLEQIVSALIAHQADVLVIAGDVFDRASPPETAVRQFNGFVRRVVAETRAAIVIIAGNHDSADRIGAMAMLADDKRALVAGPIGAGAVPLMIRDQHGEVAFAGLPFAYEFTAREHFADRQVHTPADVVARQMAAARRNVPAGARWVVAAHAFVAGAAPSESERSLTRTVGGIETVPADVFDGAHYVALGHLHRPQIVGGDERIRYAGSPLAFGFDEEGVEKSMVLIDLDGEGRFTTTLLGLTPKRRLRTLRGRLDALIEQGRSDPQANDFVRIVLTDPDRMIDPMRRLREVWPHACSLSYARDATSRPIRTVGSAASPLSAPGAMVTEFLATIRGEPPTEDEARVIAGTLDHVQAEAA